MKQIILASNNEHKLKELKQKLQNLDIDVVSQKEAGYNIDPEETGKTFKENAEIKAKELNKISGLPVLGDDSGLEIDALNGMPGVYSHRFAGENATDEDRINKVLDLMKDVKEEKRTARFKTVICYIDEKNEMHFFEGIAEGKIGFEPKGINGFGYDPIFIYNGRTFAEMTGEEKNMVSHRGRAVEKLVDYLKNIQEIY